MEGTMRKKFLWAVLCAAAITGTGASAALAGEVTGTGGPTAGPTHANSICVYSGKNDNPTSTDPENPGGVAQSYGYSVVSKGGKEFAPSPGDACNGHKSPLKGGGGGGI
jgi:hypothetical protein